MLFPAFNRWLRAQSGGAMLMVLAFLGLAVPVALGSIGIAGQLNLYSRVYDRLLRGHYAASAGAEMAFWQVLNNPTFTTNLTAVNPCADMVVNIGGQQVTVRVCRVFTSEPLQGQALVVTKSVTPTTAQQGLDTTFTYSIRLRNEGTGSVAIKQVYDYLPPRFTYVAGTTSGLTTREPSATESSRFSCGSRPYALTWNVEPDNVIIQAGQELTLTFQASANLLAGTYYNQAAVRYVPWWTTNKVDVYTPFTAEVVVGSGMPYCGFDLNIMITKTVEPLVGTPGVPQEFTYSIKTNNVSSGTIYVCQLEDKLPPTFTYVAGSTSRSDVGEPELIWDATSQRWTLKWSKMQANNLDPLYSVAAGADSIVSFRASTTPVAGANYFNEVSAVWSKELVGGHCKTGGGSGGSTNGGASATSEVGGVVYYDIFAVAPDGSIKSRIQYYEADGSIVILSWAEY